MIIELVMNVIYGVFALLTTPINIPDLPSKVSTILSSTYEYIFTGVAIITNYVNYNYLFILFSIIIAFEVGMHLYKFIMFILRKIPFLGIK